MQPSNQVGLHVHSEGSYLDGYSKVTDIAKRAAEIGQQAIALTDHGECNQHLAFQKACRAQGIAPILGIEGYWHEDISAAREKKKYPKDLSHICLLAQNQKGLSNLWALSSMAYTPKYFYYRPIADPALMREYSEGLLGSDGCLMTQFAAHVWAGDEAAARQYYATLQGIFGDRFYVELHTWQYMHPRDDDGIEFFGETITTTQANQLMTDVNQAKLRLANEMGVPVVIVNDAHHAWEQDWEKRDLVWQMNTSKGDQTPAGQKADHIMDDAELYYWMGRHGIGRSVVEEAIRNSWEIAQGCTAEIVPMLEMPTFTDTEREDMIAFIAAVEKGFKRKVVDGGLDAERYWKRMESEVELICEKRFAGYFLTVADYVRAAKTGTWQRYVGDGGKDPMITGPGRGSAGGALVSWLMDITALDPIRYDLLFERFMTPSRKGFPDIDVDFPQSRLRGMAQYLGARHGHDHVCALGTVGRNGPKGMLRDLCKVHDVPWKDRKAMSEIIEKGVEIVAASREAADESGDDLSWDEVLAEKGGDLQQYAKRYPKLFEQLGEMVGVARNSGKHASGWLINNQPLLGLIPLRTRNHGKADEVVTTQFEMGEIEELGGVKFDLLGLRHLDTLDHAAKLVTSRHGVDLDLEAFDPDVEEPEIWEPIDAGHTVGLFQVETPGSTRVAVDLKPRSVRDLAALISIVRPGVKDAGLTDRFLKRRSGDEDVVYDHPLMRPIVENTYGILVYQEQMIRAARDLAGFTAEEADQLRKVTAKKLADQIGPFETKFRDGCLANPEFMDALDGDQAAARKAIGKIWTSINASSNYAFNLCVTGDTLVKLSAAGSHTSGFMSVGDMWRRLYDLDDPRSGSTGRCRFCGSPPKRGGRGQCSRCFSWRMKFRSNHPKQGLRAWSLGEDGRLHPNRIMDVHYNGVRPVWRVTLSDGTSIAATENHRHMTVDGWREVGELSVGDELLVCGAYEPQTHSEIDRLTDVEPSYAGARLPNRERNGAQSLGYRNGGFVALREWTESQEWVCSEPGCGRSRSAGDRIERAHLDGDRRNNAASNLAMKCATHHKQHDYRVNGRRRRGQKGYPAVPMKIVSIDYVGLEDVYDLEMADPHHSWVGNGVITHNSHAVGYSHISWWEAWLGHHYPNEMLVALMATDSDNINRYVREARRRGVSILPPDINLSDEKFSISDQGIRYGLDTLVGVGRSAANDIRRRRPYASAQDFFDRTRANKTQVINLIKLGALDSLGYDPDLDGGEAALCRSRLLQQFYDHCVWKGVADSVRYKKRAPEDRAAHLAAWFDKHRADPSFETDFPTFDFADPEVVHKIEMELVGTYITVDPMGPYLSALDDVAIKDPAEVTAKGIGETFVIGGQITKVKKHTIAKGRYAGQEMAFLNIEYNELDFDITVFSDTWNTTKNLLIEGSPVACTVIRDERGCHLVSMERLDLLWKAAT